MSTRMRDAIRRQEADGAFEPTHKRIRALLDGAAVVDSARAVLLWEPRRIVPSYAVPEADVTGELVPDPEPAPPMEGPPALHPGIPFGVHTWPGERLRVRGPGGDSAEAYRLGVPGLEGYVVLDWNGFDAWMEEDELALAHPRDPFHRIDILHSSRHVRIELGGEVLAESRRPRLLFETNLPARFYLPRDEVRLELLHPTDTRTRCAYKGEASYWSVEGAGDAGADLAWSYEAPLREAAEVTGLVAFFNERCDITVDGVLQERANTPWSPTWDGTI